MSLSCNLGSAPPAPVPTKPAYSNQRIFLLLLQGAASCCRRFQGGVFGRGRCDRRDKSSGPPPLKLSLKVRRNSAHSQSSVFVGDVPIAVELRRADVAGMNVTRPS